MLNLSSFPQLRDLGNLSTDVFETRTATGRRKQMLLACSDLSQSVGKPFFLHFKLNDTDKKYIGSPREKNSQLPVAVRVSKTSVLKLPDRRICAAANKADIWALPTISGIPKYSCHFAKSYETVPRAAMTSGTTITSTWCKS